MNFSEFITLGVVQKYNHPVLLAECRKGRVELSHPFETLLVSLWIVGSGKAGEAVSRHFAFVNGLETSSGKTPPLIDEQVVHHSRQPGTRLVDVDQIGEFAVGLDQQFLEQVLGLSLLAGKPPRKPVQPVEMRAYDFLESLMLC
ncbi:MAG TPA: hypothetical protein PKH39_09145 [Woeseiaceae bacterium]|nr:hypothetical protein [Woeseiaceae bacterium]